MKKKAGKKKVAKKKSKPKKQLQEDLGQLAYVLRSITDGSYHAALTRIVERWLPEHKMPPLTNGEDHATAG